MTFKANPVQAKRCKNCNRVVRGWNKSGYCGGCYQEFKQAHIRAEKRQRKKKKQKVVAQND